MNKPHKQVITTCPVAIKLGQGRVHVIPDGTWHRKEEPLKCPQCETVFVLTDDFPKEAVLETLGKHHKDKKEHPDYLASDVSFTHVEDCTCNLIVVQSPSK
jgi:hypothetical protein